MEADLGATKWFAHGTPGYVWYVYIVYVIYSDDIIHQNWYHFRKYKFRNFRKLKRILEVAIESWPECDFNSQPLNSVQTL